MKKLKSYDDTLDRLSELPDSLILEILSFLGMEDVVRTTLLSKRWKYFWTTVPCLEFTECGRNSVQIHNFVSRALTLWRGTYLRKFSICFFSCIEVSSLSGDIDSWVLFAKERKVEELFIRLYFDGPLYCPPQCLYECSSIRKLLLFRCNLQIHGGVQWDRLNSLELHSCCFPEDVLNQIFASSTQLESVTLNDFKECENLSIRSSSLKKLSVFSLSYKLSVMTIWAPNLEALKFQGRPCSKYFLTDVSSLTEVYLKFWAPGFAKVGEAALCQILPAIQHVVTVELSASCVEMLGVIKGKYTFSPLLNVKLLRIGGGLTEISKLVGLLEIFPKLKTLIIDWEYDEELLEFNAENYTMSEVNIFKSNLLQLRTVKIIGNCSQASIFQFIELMLKHATMIEKMVIQKREYKVVESEDMFLAAQKVVSLQRSFPSVELILCKNIKNYFFWVDF